LGLISIDTTPSRQTSFWRVSVIATAGSGDRFQRRGEHAHAFRANYEFAT